MIAVEDSFHRCHPLVNFELTNGQGELRDLISLFTKTFGPE